MADLLDMLRLQDPPQQGLRPGYGIPRPGLDGVAETDSSGRPFERSTLIRGPHQLASNNSLQALSEYESRVAAPRNDVFGNTLAEDTPAAMQQSLLAPFQMGLQAGMRALKPIVEKPPQSRNVGGSLLERNPLSGEWEVKFSGTPKMDDASKSNVRMLEREIGTLMAGRNNPAVGTLANPNFAADTDAEIAKKRAELKAVLNPVAAPRYLVDPMSIPSGNPTSSMIPSMPGTNATRLPRILNIRRR